MKTKTILFLFLLISGMMSAQVKRVAILETVDKENKVTYANKLILRANLSKAITNTAGYEAYDRTDIDAIMGEQNFQRTGMVSNEQIKRLGEMTGANYILVAEAVVIDVRTMFITAKLLDVETARTILTDNLIMGTSTDEIQEGCINLAKRLFHEEVNNEQKVSQANQIVEEVAKPTYELIHYSKSEQKLLGVKEFSYGEKQMDDKMFQKFLMQNNREVYANYMQGKKMITAGWWMLGGGLVLAAPIGGTLVGVGGYGGPALITGIICMTVGSAAAITSAPLLVIGQKRSSTDTVDMFNEQSRAKATTVSLNLQASQNGIGLALNF